MIELELTYLAKSIPAELRAVRPEAMVDIYLPQDPAIAHPNLRVRQRGNMLEITKKKPVVDGDASTQKEQTIPLTAPEFEDLKKASQRTVVKDRYKVEIEGRSAEIDVFRDKLQGLVLIDFELNNQEEKAAFKPPSCCLAEVTQEDFIAGGLLAGKTYANIEADLQRFGYKALNI